MNIKDFILNYNNHPVLFIGTGMSLRYLKNSYTWDGLLSKIAFDLTENEEYYLDLKSKCYEKGKCKFDKLASLLESDFNEILSKDRHGKFETINNVFYENMRKEVHLSRFKIYISQLLSDVEHKEEMVEEISELKKIRKNIGSVITTNYDTFIENIFNFNPLVGNNILLSNPYGSVYKIHGCISEQEQIIITEEDYKVFFEKYELIRAQLLSLFIHNPIIFMGYSISDENIKNILKTIFTYIQPNSDEAEKIRKNFLLIEHEQGSDSEEIVEHDIDMEEFSIIRINKIKTGNFMPLYTALSNLNLSVSAMDIRKVQNIVKEIYSGGDIKVTITDDLDALHNDEKILAIGSVNTINYDYQNNSEMISNYFQIIDESNHQLLTLIDKHIFPKSNWFPIFAFSKINDKIVKSNVLKKQQTKKINSILNSMNDDRIKNHTTLHSILNDELISTSNINNSIFWSILKEDINLKEVENYLITYEDKNGSDYRKLVCAYDYQKYK